MGKNLDNKGKQSVMWAKETCWESDIDTVKSCGKAPNTIDVWISPLVKMKIDRMMELFSNIEWLGYLIGKTNKVNDLVIPKQKVSVGSVTDIDSSVCNSGNVIGVIHSHHSMGNDFSKTDDDWINQNNDISLCISNKGINGHMRWKTPCGSLILVKAIVRVMMDVDFDKNIFDETVKRNVKKEIYRNTLIPTRFNGGFIYDEEEDWFLDEDEDEDMTLEKELTLMEESEMFTDM